MLRKLAEQTEVIMGLAVVSTIAMLILPMPAILLDLLLVISILIGIVTLLTALNMKEINEFSVFPSLLLVTTIFRLALNVSSTRLILLEGPQFNGKLIRAFGEFVVGGNYVIGFIIFLILVLVQMVVISKGANRMSEVSARFALDALPGKQMAIEADSNAGFISEEEMRSRRDGLRRETDFYGRMDGATKFVQGDVRLGLVITAINIVGGLIIGAGIRGESFTEALRVYTLLTIGDGLVAQIPSLLITSATGMVVARAGALDALSTELREQLFRNARVLFLTGGALFFASLIPGFPKISLWLISAILIGVGYYTYRQEETTQEKVKADQASPRPTNPTETVLEEYGLDKIKLEVGINLLNIAQQSLVERITNLRRKLAKESGILVPPVRVSDNIHDLEPQEYAILVGGTEVSRGKADPVRLVAIVTPNVSDDIEGEEFIDPAFGVKSFYIDASKKAEAEAKGYIVVDAPTVIITNLSEVIRDHVTQVMGREEVKMLIDKVKERYPTVVEEALDKAGMGIITALLQSLVKENVAIRNILTILETLIANIERTKDVRVLTEYVRQSLGRQIAGQYAENGKIHVIQIDPIIENEMRESITYDERDGRIFVLEPGIQQLIRNALMESFSKVQSEKGFPVFICGSEVRFGIFSILERELKSRTFAVIAYEEIPRDISLEKAGFAEMAEVQEEIV